MTRRMPLRLTFARKLTLGIAGIAALAVPLAIGILRAQTLPPPPAYRFEVASIRRADPDARDSHIGLGPQGGLRTQNTAALSLITFAYDLCDFQVVGGPGWIRSDRFNVTGTPDKPEEQLSPNVARNKFESWTSRQRQRVQALLSERFGLVLRAETRDMPVYGLTIAKNGHKLTPTADEKKGPNINMHLGRLMATAANMKMLTPALSTLLGRTVIDETGLDGLYDLSLEWTQDSRPDEPAQADTGGASIFAAIQEQLGLKLESKKGPVPVFVIEKIEKPSEN